MTMKCKMKSTLFVFFVVLLSSSTTGLCQKLRMMRTDYVQSYGPTPSGTTYDIFVDKWTSNSYQVTGVFAIQPSAILVLDSVLQKYNIARNGFPIAFSHHIFSSKDSDKLSIKIADVGLPTSVRDSLDAEIKKIESICKVTHLYGDRDSFTFTVFYQKIQEEAQDIPDSRKPVVESSMATDPIVEATVDSVLSYCKNNGVGFPNTFDLTVVFGKSQSTQEVEGHYVEDYKTHRYLHEDFYSILLDRLKEVCNSNGSFITIKRNLSESTAPILLDFVENNYIKCFGPLGINTHSPYGPYRDILVSLNENGGKSKIQDLYAIEPSVIEILDSELKCCDASSLKIDLLYDTNNGKLIVDSLSYNGDAMFDGKRMKEELQNRIASCKVSHLYGKQDNILFPLLWEKHNPESPSYIGPHK